jgi:hypothetical protein
MRTIVRRTPFATIGYRDLRSATAPEDTRWVFGDVEPRIKDFDSFDHTKQGYDAKTAYLMAIVSAWAYADAEALASKLRFYGLERARIRQVSVVNDALLVVASGYLILSGSGRVGILAFRGTDPTSLVTWLADAEVTQRTFCDSKVYPGAKVHAGFFANLQEVWDEVARALSFARERKFVEPQVPGQPRKIAALPESLQALYVTGHSLGGAMALLAAARLFRGDFADWHPEQLVRGVYTFGQPMVGNPKFADFVNSTFKEKIFRHVYNKDVVPHLPPDSGFEYCHVGSERRAYELDQSWGVTESSGRADTVSAIFSSVATAIEARLSPELRIGPYSIDDHMPANYVDVSRNMDNGKPPEEGATPREEIDQGLEMVLGGVGRIVGGATELGLGAVETVGGVARAVQQAADEVIKRLPHVPSIPRLP